MADSTLPRRRVPHLEHRSVGVHVPKVPAMALPYALVHPVAVGVVTAHGLEWAGPNSRVL